MATVERTWIFVAAVAAGVLFAGLFAAIVVTGDGNSAVRLQRRYHFRGLRTVADGVAGVPDRVERALLASIGQHRFERV